MPDSATSPASAVSAAPSAAAPPVGSAAPPPEAAGSVEAATPVEAAAPVEVRVLTGPNLYFSRPTIKLTLDAGAALTAEAGDVAGWMTALRVRSTSVGLPHSPVRAAGVAALAAALTRRAATTIRARLPAVGRPGDDDTVVVAFPFRHEGTAETFANAVAAAFAAITAGASTVAQALAAVPAALAGHDPGPTIRQRAPRIPVIAVTGTNGKTTTTRLIAHLAATDGRVPGWSSTDGVIVAGEVVETGDWSGPGGAARVLADRRVTLAVTETARGGILLRGIGTPVNDVSVITNVSPDHLGLLGIHTLEQLAEVKSVVARITKPTGWTVLNADDPLVREMRSVSRAKPWFFSTDPHNPYLEQALAIGGRAITVVDGEIRVLEAGFDPTVILPIDQVPLTLAGASKVNVANVLAATAAALAVGIAVDVVRRGLLTFAASAAQNSGRLNVYGVGSTAIVIDLAHNEASVQSLLDVASALRRPPGIVGIAVATAGDRTDEAIHAMGAMAAAQADRLIIVERHKYLRGRSPGAMEEVWRGGAVEAGVVDVHIATTEVDALAQFLDGDLPAGSTVAICALEQREELVAAIMARGGHELTAADIAVRLA